MNTNKWQTILAACQPAYGFLARAFYEEPESTFIGFLFDENLFADWPLESNAHFSQTGLDLLRDFGRGWEEGKLTDLIWDYRRLFVGPGPLKAYPWESVYLGKDHVLFDEHTINVRQLYRQAGLQASRQRREPEDHIGLELAFMTHLCGQALEAIERADHAALADCLNMQRDFLHDHLLCWTPAFAQAVIQHADTGYYRGVAYLLLGTLDTAARLFGLELEIKESTLDAEPTRPAG